MMQTKPCHINKTLSMRRDPELIFTSEKLTLLRRNNLTHKAGGSFANVNHAREVEIVEPQELIFFY